VLVSELPLTSSAAEPERDVRRKNMERDNTDDKGPSVIDVKRLIKNDFYTFLHLCRQSGSYRSSPSVVVQALSTVYNWQINIASSSSAAAVAASTTTFFNRTS